MTNLELAQAVAAAIRAGWNVPGVSYAAFTLTSDEVRPTHSE
jgi:hypothetical protein